MQNDIRGEVKANILQLYLCKIALPQRQLKSFKISKYQISYQLGGWLVDEVWSVRKEFLVQESF